MYFPCIEICIHIYQLGLQGASPPSSILIVNIFSLYKQKQKQQTLHRFYKKKL